MHRVKALRTGLTPTREDVPSDLEGLNLLENKTDILGNVPNDLVFAIVSKMSVHAVCKLVYVSKAYGALSSNQSLWERICRDAGFYFDYEEPPTDWRRYYFLVSGEEVVTLSETENSVVIHPCGKKLQSKTGSYLFSYELNLVQGLNKHYKWSRGYLAETFRGIPFAKILSQKELRDIFSSEPMLAAISKRVVSVISSVENYTYSLYAFSMSQLGTTLFISAKSGEIVIKWEPQPKNRRRDTGIFASNLAIKSRIQRWCGILAVFLAEIIEHDSPEKIYAEKIRNYSSDVHIPGISAEFQDFLTVLLNKYPNIDNLLGHKFLEFSAPDSSIKEISLKLSHLETVC